MKGRGKGRRGRGRKEGHTYLWHGVTTRGKMQIDIETPKF
jgi:hypothetical protein